ncbi:MAG: GntR family transcriptional regulator [Firmicutes bacterium]|nr:GntR family transcriptional regulator [Bacillota bacterium]
MSAGMDKGARLDRNVPIALYYQIAEVLRREIREKGLRPGDFLTTEEELQVRFGVSRATARRALEELVDEGLVVRITGKGTYVARSKVNVQLPTLLSFTEEIRRLGMVPGSRVIGVDVVAAPEPVGIHLELDEGDQVLRIERIRYADKTPIVHLVDYLPMWLQIGPETDFNGSLYALLESRDIEVAEAVHTIEAGLTDEILARYLEVAVGFPVVRCRRTTYDPKGQPIVYEEAACRGDLYSYTVRLKRQGAEQQESVNQERH